MAKIWVEAYGCSASFADSEMISGLIVNGGHSLARNSAESDLNLIVTCSVKDATADKMVNRIKKLGSKPSVVAGCLPKAERTTVERFNPNASMLGPNSIGKSLEVINSTLLGKRTIALEDLNEIKVGLPKVRLNPAVGIIEIASGCMSECTFCQTKLSKGDLKSYRIGDITRQVKRELDEGCKEIWLTSTDNGCYGFDIGTNLPSLIETVGEIDDDFMIRIGMMNPMYMHKIRDGLLQSFENSKVFKFLHIPVQSGSNKILKEMQRGHTAKIFIDTVRRFREKFEKFTISTDIIVGFPSESKEDFAQTIEIIKKTKPDVINLSRYSSRPGTKAAKMTQLDVHEVKKRSKQIFELAKKISYERNQEWIGWEGEVLVDENVNEMIKGRNYAYKPVMIRENVRLGKKITVKISDVTSHGLYGDVLS